MGRPSSEALHAVHNKENGGSGYEACTNAKHMTLGHGEGPESAAGRMTRSSARIRQPLYHLRHMHNQSSQPSSGFPDILKFDKRGINNQSFVPRYFLRDHLRSPSKAGNGPTAIRSDSEASPIGELPMFDVGKRKPEPGATPMPRAFGSILRDLPEAPRKASTESPDAFGSGSSLLPSGAKSPLAQSCPVQNPRRTTRYRPRLRARARRVLDLHANGNTVGTDQGALLERRQTRASTLGRVGENGPPPVLSGNVRKAEDQTIPSPMDITQGPRKARRCTDNQAGGSDNEKPSAPAGPRVSGASPKWDAAKAEAALANLCIGSGGWAGRTRRSTGHA